MDRMALIVGSDGARSIIDTAILPEWLHPSAWWEKLYWRYNRVLSEDEVYAYLKDATEEGPPISTELARKIGTYMVDYAKHVVVIALVKGAPEEYLEGMKPTILEVDRMARGVKTGKDVRAIMLRLLEVAIDPL